MMKYLAPIFVATLFLMGCPISTNSSNQNPEPTIESSPSPTPSLAAQAFSITGVTLNKSVLSLNAKPSTGTPAQGYVTSEQLEVSVQASDNQVHAVTWSSSDTMRVTVDNGLVSTVSDAATGDVIITATSVDDPGKSATVVVTVTRAGDATLEIE